MTKQDNQDNPVKSGDDIINDLKQRLWDTRREWFKAQDEAHALRLKLAKTRELHGPTWANRTECNDGRVWATPAYDNREGWIRCFAGQALCGAYFTGRHDITVCQIADDAQALWLELERRFDLDRAGREAIREAKRQAEESQGELWRPDDQIQNKETEAKS